MFLLNSASFRRFLLTLITGYLAIFAVQQIPYEFPNQWAILIPVLIVVYVITVWLDGVFFKGNESPVVDSSGSRQEKTKSASIRSIKGKANGFGNS